MRTILVLSIFLSVLASVGSPRAGADELPLVVVTVGDSGAVLAGHPGGIGCAPWPLFLLWGCDAPVSNPSYVPPLIDPALFRPGYHADGLIVSELAERGVDAIVWPRAVFGSRSDAWANADQAVCSPDPDGPDGPVVPTCGKSPGEVADEIAGIRSLGFEVVVWYSAGVGPVADVFDGTDGPVAWHDEAAWDLRFAEEAAYIQAAIDVLRAEAADTPVILPGYANLNSANTYLLVACGWLAAGPFQAPLLNTKWDQMYHPLLNGGGIPVYGAFNRYEGTGHPTGVAGMLASIADADPTIAFGNAGLALRDDAATGPAWLPSPLSELQRDCIHLKPTGQEDLVSHVLDTVAPQIPGM